MDFRKISLTSNVDRSTLKIHETLIHPTWFIVQGAASIARIARSRNLHHGSSVKKKRCPMMMATAAESWKLSTVNSSVSAMEIFVGKSTDIFLTRDSSQFSVCFLRHENQVGPNSKKYLRMHVHLPTFLGLTTQKKQIYPMDQLYITIPPWASSHPPNIDGFLFTWTMTVTCEKPRSLFKKTNIWGFLWIFNSKGMS